MTIGDETGNLMISLNAMQKSIRTMLETIIKQSEILDASVDITNENIQYLEHQI